ncbi:DUF2267 domain-containing protein [Streptomyces caatingaensis]|uniref:DUF2267 domain-containing protein n=1 Tax=Streptomyces caatingaensis TaxID=1678637 RepID=A0A0K9XLS5_9ACTN|nr:DUF2267 domain-containing protein [Streptomyces caatingaensis]KNB54041.1 hypothetical protein AC230_05700 [Streptomyces caatingaensis]
MQHSQAPAAPGTTPALSYDRMLEQVRRNGAYATRERAEHAVTAVLSALGRRLTGEERVELAARLPREAAEILAAQIPQNTPMTGWAFVKDIADRTGAGLAITRWDVGSVLTVVARLAGPALLDRILTQLRPGYALLFGRAELLQAA